MCFAQLYNLHVCHETILEWYNYIIIFLFTIQVALVYIRTCILPILTTSYLQVSANKLSLVLIYFQGLSTLAVLAHMAQEVFTSPILMCCVCQNLNFQN